MTEASSSIISQRESKTHILNTIGRLLPGIQLRVVDENDQGGLATLNTWQTYAIDLVGRDYVGLSDSSKATAPGGSFRSGDVGYIDKHGFIFLVDQIKEIIKVKGNQVAPAELGALLISHPSVSDAAVCGIHLEHEATEYPTAYITTREPSETHTTLTTELRNLVDDQVAHYKRLEGGIYIIQTIPRK